MDAAVVSDLFEEVVFLFREDVSDGSVPKTFESFREYIADNLPDDSLQSLKGLLGVDEDEDNGDEAFLRDIYSERFEPRDDADEDINAPFGSALLCEICERHTKLTRHHLYPKQLHGKLEGRVPANLLNRTLNICRMCHSTVHRLFTNEELAASYNTLESLMATEPMAKYAKWASRQKGGDKRVL
jgi:hypothetical protein